MTLGANLSGDAPRDYNLNVVMIPGQLVNVSDLVGSVNISGGTYTYPREGAGEGSISAQTEGSSKSQRDYDFTMVDLATNFIAGFTRYSKKMANNLPFLTSFIPNALRRDYAIAENTIFNTILAAAATASAQIITGKNKVEMLMNEIATQEGLNYPVNAIVLRPADYWDILKTEKSTGAGYGLPGVVTIDAQGNLRINGIPLLKANWLAANKYYVADWTRINKIVTEGLSLEFSETEGTNFVTNNITARIEAQVGLAVEQPAAIIYGDFTAVA
jgi:HK97 family phage major capsid protein